MKHLFLSAVAALLLCSAALATLTPPAYAGEAHALSGKAKMLVGEWAQGADRMVGEGDESILVSQGREKINADGTSRTTLQIKLLVPDMPDDLRVYNIAMEGTWTLIGDEIHTSPASVIAMPVGTNPAGLNVAKVFEAEFMKPTDPMILVSINADNYVARATDGTLISMTRQ